MQTNDINKYRKNITNMNKSLILLLSVIFILSFVSASTDGDESTLGSIKQNQSILLTQNCVNNTYSTINFIGTYGETSSNLLSNPVNMSMISEGNQQFRWNNTITISHYLVSGICDENGEIKSWSYDFYVTPSGFIDTLGFYIIIIILLGGLLLMGFKIEEEWFVVLGGMGFIMLGIYSINYGIAGFRDMFMTWGLGLFEIAVGTILSVGAGYQKFRDD